MGKEKRKLTITGLTEGQKVWLENVAAEQGLSMSALIKSILSAAIKADSMGKNEKYAQD